MNDLTPKSFMYEPELYALNPYLLHNSYHIHYPSGGWSRLYAIFILFYSFLLLYPFLRFTNLYCIVKFHQIELNSFYIFHIMN